MSQQQDLDTARPSDSIKHRATTIEEVETIHDALHDNDYVKEYCRAAGIDLDYILSIPPCAGIAQLQREFAHCDKPTSGELGYEPLPDEQLTPSEYREMQEDGAERARTGSNPSTTIRDDADEEVHGIGSNGERVIGKHHNLEYNDKKGDTDGGADYVPRTLSIDAKIRDYYDPDGLFAMWPEQEPITADVYIIAHLTGPISEETGVHAKILGYTDKETVKEQEVEPVHVHKALRVPSRRMAWEDLNAPVPKPIVRALHADLDAL